MPTAATAPRKSSSSSPTERRTKGPGYLAPTSPYRTNPCQTAVDIAGDSKAKGVLMYSIAYDVSGDGAQACTADRGSIVNGVTVTRTVPESPAIQGDEALQEIASPGNYYAQPEPVALTNIFLAISADIAKGTSRING